VFLSGLILKSSSTYLIYVMCVILEGIDILPYTALFDWYLRLKQTLFSVTYGVNLNM